MKIAGLLLAAGSASRFGADKLRHPLPHGVEIAVQAARHLRAEIDDVFAVVRSDKNDFGEKLKAEGCRIIICENAAEGMGASLACAARAAGRRDGYLVALGDMPFVRPSSIAAVRDALGAGALVAAPYFHGRRGHPVGIAGAFYEELLQLKGDAGAKGVLERNAVTKIPVGDPGVIRDIDTPGDLAPPARV